MSKKITGEYSTFSYDNLMKKEEEPQEQRLGFVNRKKPTKTASFRLRTKSIDQIKQIKDNINMTFDTHLNISATLEAIISYANKTKPKKLLDSYYDRYIESTDNEKK